MGKKKKFQFFHDQFTMQKNLQVSRDEENLYLSKFCSALHSESHKIIYGTELISFPTSNQSSEKAAILHAT